MSNFETLKKLVADDEVELIHVEAIPRSVSTALSRALSESDTPSVYVNEPFNRMQHDIEDGSRRLLEVIIPRLKDADDRLTVISKNMARNISTELLGEIAEMSSGFVWAIRDPHVQISSLITRIANDLQYEAGADTLKQEDLSDEQIQLACDFLENGPKSTNFSKTSWQDIGEHFRSGNRPDVSEVVDGGEFTNRPIEVLGRLAAQLGLKYHSRMVAGWQGEFINANTGYSTTLSDSEHAWTKDAVTSTGIQAIDRVGIEFERFPRSMQIHLSQVAIPAYMEMTGRSISND